MIIDNLYLEITRNCSFECEHCLRGNKENKNMSLATLENILKDIKHIKRLLLSGGEPLINIKLLEELPELIKKYNITIEEIGIITNGTIMSPRHLIALDSLSKCCDRFSFFLSNDLFHRLEGHRLGLEDIIVRNYDTYNKRYSLEKYPRQKERYCNISLAYKGKAKELTEQRIKEITKGKYIHYYFEDIPFDQSIACEGNIVHGKVCIDVNGNLVDYSMSYDEEDELADNGLNVNLFPLSEIIQIYIDDYIERNKNHSLTLA